MLDASYDVEYRNMMFCGIQSDAGSGSELVADRCNVYTTVFLSRAGT